MKRRKFFRVPVFNAENGEWLGSVSYVRSTDMKDAIENACFYETELDYDAMDDLMEQIDRFVYDAWFCSVGENCIMVITEGS